MRHPSDVVMQRSGAIKVYSPLTATSSAVVSQAADPDTVVLDLPGAGAVGRLLAVAIALLAVGHAVTQSALVFGGHDFVYGMVPLFDLDAEGALGTWYASTTLLLCAAFLWTIAGAKRRMGHRYLAHWGVLAAGFTFMAVDEVARIHDGIVGEIVKQAFHPRGFLFAFVVPGAIISVVVLLSFIGFLAHLPRRSGWLFFLAGAIYVGGAVGLESLGGQLQATVGQHSWQYSLEVLVEETMENAGVALFIYALLDYARRALPPLRVNVWR